MIEFVTELASLFGLIFTDPAYLVREGKTYVILFPAYILLLGGERIFHEVMREEKWNNRDSAANLLITGIMALRDITIGVIVPLGIIIFLYENFRIFTIPEVWWGWLLVFVIWDFFWYVDHRLGHRTGLFWTLHQVHHSSEEYNMTVSSRGFIIEFVQRPTWLLMPILGISPVMFVTMKIFTSIWGIAQHTRLVPKLGMLDRMFATPSTHRVHHGSDAEYIDKNYGEITLLWDHLFRTYQPEQQVPTYGLTKIINTYNPVNIQISGIRWLMRQMRNAPSLTDKIRYLYKPPGWQHNAIADSIENPNIRDLKPEYIDLKPEQ